MESESPVLEIQLCHLFVVWPQMRPLTSEPQSLALRNETQAEQDGARRALRPVPGAGSAQRSALCCIYPGLFFKVACLRTPPQGWVATHNPALREPVTSLATEADRSFKKCNFRIDILHAKPRGRRVHSAGERSGAVTQKEDSALTLPFGARAADKRIVQMNL